MVEVLCSLFTRNSPYAIARTGKRLGVSMGYGLNKQNFSLHSKLVSRTQWLVRSLNSFEISFSTVSLNIMKFLRSTYQVLVYSTDRSKAVVPVLVLLFVALWFILRGDLLYVFPCVILFLCFSVLLVLRLPRFGKRELILVLFVRLFDLCLFGFVGFLFLGVWEGLRFVIVAIPGLSVTFFF